jgi:hypothetical protein
VDCRRPLADQPGQAPRRLRIGAAGKTLPWTRDPSHLNAFRVDVPADVAALELRFQQLLSLHDDSYSSVLTRKIGAVAFHRAVLYPAGYQVSPIELDASVRFPAG